MASKKRKRSDLDALVVDDASALNSQQDHQPETRSRDRLPVPVQGPGTLNADRQQTTLQSMAVMQPSSMAESDEDIEVASQCSEHDVNLFLNATLDPAVELDAGTKQHGTRGAAVDAAPRIHLYACADRTQTELVDDDSEESEKSDDEMAYAPFEKQLEADLCGPLTHSELDIIDCEDVGILPGPNTQDRARYTELVKAVETDGLHPLIEYTLASELQSGSKFGKFFAEEASEFWHDMSRMTLCTMPSGVLHELTCGNLKRAYDNDPVLKESLDRNAEQGREHPSIYARVLTSPSGNPLTIADARHLASMLLSYASPDTPIFSEFYWKTYHIIDTQSIKTGKWPPPRLAIAVFSVRETARDPPRESK